MAINSASYEFRHPEARLLADLHVVEQDMQRAIQFIAPLRLGPTWGNLTADDTEMHWIAAVIAYARPFGTGVLRWDAAGALSQLTPKLAVLHRVILDIRGGYIAHSVGDWENPCPVVQVVTGEDGSREIRSVVCNASRIVGPGSDLAEALHELALEIQKTVQKWEREERARLLLLAQALGVEAITANSVWDGGKYGRAPRKPRKFEA